MATDWVRTPRPDPLDGVVDCPECRVHAVASPHLVGAAASVGIECGRSTGAVLRAYLAEYHQGGHKIDRSGGGEQR